MTFYISKTRRYQLALVAIIMVGSILVLHRHQQQKEEAELAYKNTKKALLLLASHWDRGTEKMAHLNQFETSIQKIYHR